MYHYSIYYIHTTTVYIIYVPLQYTVYCNLHCIYGMYVFVQY